MTLNLTIRLVLLVAQYLVAWTVLRLVHDRELPAAPLLCEGEAVIGFIPVPSKAWNRAAPLMVIEARSSLLTHMIADLVCYS